MTEIILNAINWEFILRLLLACLCGALVGYERNRRHKDAGIRTHLLVSLGAALITIVSSHGFGDDPSRVAANIVTGIGFLGAGVIFMRGRAVTGLTTAAGIWTMAGVGMAIGTGMYALGVLATLLVVVLQNLMHRMLPSNEQLHWQMTVKLQPGAGVQALRDALAQIPDLAVESYQVARADGDVLQVQLTCVSASPMDVEWALRLMQEHPAVTDIKG